MGPGHCRWASACLLSQGFPRLLTLRDGKAPADQCEHFEMSAAGVDLCKENGIVPGDDCPGSMARQPTPTIKIGGQP